MDPPNRAKQPKVLDADELGGVLKIGIGEWRLRYVQDNKVQLFTYNFEGGQGQDRVALENNKGVLFHLLKFNPTGVFNKVFLRGGLMRCNSLSEWKFLGEDFAEGILDKNVSALGRMLLDLGVCRRRHKHDGTVYVDWLQRLVDMITNDGLESGVSFTTPEKRGNKFGKLHEVPTPPKPGQKRRVMMRQSSTSSMTPSTTETAPYCDSDPENKLEDEEPGYTQETCICT